MPVAALIQRPTPGKSVTDAQNDSYDVIVVGGGGTGLAAAIEAAGAGARTVLIEKNPALGGSTGWSVGSISVSATPHQAAKGVVDSPEDHWRDMALFNGALDKRDNPALRRVLTEELPGTFRWLLSHGLRFYGPMPEPPHTKPRMHNVLPNSRSFIRNLERAARRAGATIVTSTRAEELMTSNGRVTAVACTTPQVHRAPRGGTHQRRFHQRPRVEGPLHGRTGSQGLGRQSDCYRRRTEARGQARRAHPQWRSRARPRITLRAAKPS